ncbi:type II secretion system F family protein [Paraburkholderia sp. BL10I2N1]|uniref:type II secretion system F family protein n=1 Tax=Paraburkholderia sp. BL10I2N1 TaxID=1938796 RepID=UPI00105C3781|nr:type II secretion system F family protein [Paraburkholderia sp. BL10I2N1]TDN67271.1 type II secretion system protein F (GspF) [Paraburkholderia sp. BL10I2N1]
MNILDAGTATNLALLIVLISAVALILLRTGSTRHRIAQRVRQVAAHRAADSAADERTLANMRQRLTRRVALIGEQVPFLNAFQREKLAEQLASAGFRDRRTVAGMVGLKIIVGSLLALVAIVLGAHVPRFGEHFAFRVLMMAAAFIVGMIAPEYALGLLISRRQKAISSCLPDALDLLVICTNAGNSLVVAIKRVAHELTPICPPLADEFSVTADELQMGTDSATALRNMAARIGLSSVRGLVTTLIQSQQYGTPITQSLRMLSRAERAAQIFALEEKAAKLAPKMTLPMMLFVLPTVGLIATGPAVIQLLAVFK